MAARCHTAYALDGRLCAHSLGLLDCAFEWRPLPLFSAIFFRPIWSRHLGRSVARALADVSAQLSPLGPDRRIAQRLPIGGRAAVCARVRRAVMLLRCATASRVRTLTSAAVESENERSCATEERASCAMGHDVGGTSARSGSGADSVLLTVVFLEAHGCPLAIVRPKVATVWDERFLLPFMRGLLLRWCGWVLCVDAARGLVFSLRGLLSGRGVLDMLGRGAAASP